MTDVSKKVKEEKEENLIVISQATRDKLVVDHGKEKLRIVELPMDDLGIKKMEVVVKVPSRSVVGQFMRFITDNPKKAQEILVNSCLLTSIQEVNDNDELFTACVTGIIELIPSRQGVVKNF